MNKRFSIPSPNDQGLLVGFAALLFGTWLRLSPVFTSGFPINDGGLFYTVIESMIDGRFRFPQFIQYNGLEIPFAYPPLAFYLASLGADLLKIPSLTILQWLPALVLILTIPAFFLLAETITGSRFQAGIASLLFAFNPRSINWLIMGGGLTRSLGELFLILATRELYLLFTCPNSRTIIRASIYCSLVVLSHPEAALHTLGIALIFWVFLSHNQTGLRNAFFVGGAVLVISALWWAPVVANHGLAPFLAASRTNYNTFSAIFHPFFTLIIGDGSIVTITILGFIGAAIYLHRRQFLLSAWWMMHFVLEARNAENVAVIPIAILASAAITEAIFPVFSEKTKHLHEIELSGQSLNRPRLIILSLLTIYLVGTMAYSNSYLAARSVSPEIRQAIEWIKNNSAVTGRFLVLTGEPDPFFDGVTEWFPALANRTNITTIQGQEWLKDRDLGLRTQQLKNLQECLHEASALACIDEKLEAQGEEYDYMLIARNSFFPIAATRIICPAGFF